MNKKLKRDSENAVIGGVLAGLANYFDQDPVLFRVLAIIFMILTGFFPGLLIYLIAFVIMPLENSHHSKKADYEVVD